MTEMRPINTSDYAALSLPSSLGRPPRLEYLRIADLVVDPLYQRAITGRSRIAIRRIATAFDWSKFTPVIVAPAGGGRFAIVDGQHRTTAAALVGADKVPCAIIDGERVAQAAAFGAINGNVTKLTSIQLHHALVAAGDKKAQRLEAVCARADVVLLRYPKPAGKIEAGETMAIKAIARAIEKFGDECVITALRVIRESGDGNAGLLRVPVIFGVAEVLNDHADWRESGGALIEALDTIDLYEMYDAASSVAARTAGSTVTDQFEALLIDALSAAFKKAHSTKRSAKAPRQQRSSWRTASP